MTDNTNETQEQPTPTTGTPPGQQAGQDKTFTQADVDRLIKDRLERQEASILKKYGDPKAAKDALTRLKELEDASKTDVQKLTETLTEREQRLAKAEQAAQRATLDNAVILEALKQGVSQDRLNAALKLFDDKTITRNDDGTLTGLEDGVKKLLEDNPFLKADAGQQKTATPKLGATNPQGAGQSNDLRSWHPLYRSGASNFTGRVVEPPPEGNKK